MKITVQSSKAVKPDYGGAPAPPATAVVPLTVFDLISFDDYMFGIHAFHPPSPPTGTLVAGLAMALAHYREWAGRLVAADPATGRRRGILLNDAGVRFLDATAEDTIESAMPLLRQPTPEVRRLHPSAPATGGDDELMLVQVTRFACGSVVVGHAMHHAVGDAFAISRFLVAWGQATRGAAAIDPVPVHDRTSFFTPRHPPRVDFDHRGAEFVKPRQKKDDDARSNAGDGRGAVAGEEVVVQHVRFSREFISELKSRDSSSSPGRPYSTAQCLAAHLWRCVTKARGLAAGDETKTTLHLAVNGRARMRGLPEGYTGNAVLWAHPCTTARELLAAAPLGRAVELVRGAVARVDDSYFRSFIDFASSGAVEEEGLVPALKDPEAAELGADVAVYCLLRVPFYDVDFGGGCGRQFFYTPGYYPAEGVVYILPPAPVVGDGSVEAHVSLFSRDVESFRGCCFSIDAGEPSAEEPRSSS
ncbi:unnamed protein product [Urochloa decumbens]|uniref:Uncharacterized protein n=1 Tax=Urochloa decumbens TaxID=240449 RepID=A0ABC9BKN0_9POAL